MKKTLLLFMFIFVITCLQAHAYVIDGWHINGFIKNETAWNVGDGRDRVVVDNVDSGDLMKMENMLQLEITKAFSDFVEFYFAGRLFYDAVFDFENDGWVDNNRFFHFRNDLSQPKSNSMTDLLRELYVDIYLKKWTLRLGKQQVVWGNTEGLKMLDIINPTDLREFNQDKFEDSRIPLWMIKAEYRLGINTTAQFLLVPDVEQNYNAPPGSPYAIKAVQDIEVPLALNILSLRKNSVTDGIDNMEIGFRFMQNFGTWEYSLNYFYHWTDYPGVYFQGIVPNSRSPIGITTLLEQRFKRVHSIGGKFSKSFESLLGLKSPVIRLEWVLDLDDIGQELIFTPFGAQVIQNRSDDLNYAISLDKEFLRPLWLWPYGLNMEISYFQTITLDYKSNYLTALSLVPLDEYQNSVSLYLWTYYINKELSPEVLIAYDDDGGWWMRPRVQWDVTADLICVLGANLYWGHRSTTWGQYKENDQVVFEIKYGW